MKEVIITVGVDGIEIDKLREHLKKHGYYSIRCCTLRGLIDKLQLLPICSIDMILVLIEPGILRNAGDDLIAELSESAQDVPFVWFDDGAKILFAAKEQLSGSIQQLISTGFKLSEHVLKVSV